jgi:hypothetical protein
LRRTSSVLILLLLAFGCARAPRQAPVVTYRTAGAASLLAAYNANAAKIPALSATLEMTLFYTEDGRRKKHALDAWLDVEKPARVRLKHDSLSRDLFYVVCDGERFWVAFDRALAGGKDTVYTGTLASLKHESLFRPDRLLAAFSLSPLPPAGASEPVLESYNDSYVLSFLDSSQPRRAIARATFSRVDLRLSRFQAFDDQSRLALAVNYLDYESLSGAYVPSIVSIDWPLDGFSIIAKVEKPSIPPSLPERLWNFQWRKDAVTVDLDATVTVIEDSPRKGD